MSEELKVVKLKTKTKQLTDMYGGIWKYDGVTTWWCDDDKRSVARTHGHFGCDDDDCRATAYWLYGDGSPQQVYFNSPFLKRRAND